MMMSLNEPRRPALGSIEDSLAGSDPKLASMLNIFSRLAAGEEMPAREKIPIRRGRPTARPRRARRRPRRGTARPQARPLYARLGRQQAMLLLWAGISAGLVAVALVLSTSGPNASCIRSLGTACPSPSIPQHAAASHVMNPPATPARARTVARARRPGGYLP